MLSVNMSIVYTIINLLILYAFFRKFLFGRVDKILKERKEQIEGVSVRLDEELDKAAAEKKLYETQTRELEEQKESTLAEWRGRGFEEYNRIVAEAKVEAGRIVADARKTAETEATITREKNQEAIKDMVIDAASRISVQSADKVSDSALYDAFIRDLKSSGESAS
ncbi:MAG: ATP synthase F0 subunit B [Lachnospiraceae bacterium]|nr:ATP synthase F0 subunit B [Lachnospiraceae bacterium]